MKPSQLLTIEISPKISLGWFGIPGSTVEGTKTHLVLEGKPVCGSRLRPEMEYQWCSNSLTAFVPECNKCRQIQTDLIELKQYRKTYK